MRNTIYYIWCRIYTRNRKKICHNTWLSWPLTNQSQIQKLNSQKLRCCSVGHWHVERENNNICYWEPSNTMKNDIISRTSTLLVLRNSEAKISQHLTGVITSQIILELTGSESGLYFREIFLSWFRAQTQYFNTIEPLLLTRATDWLG